jgi:AcrR family transcriptional regulator
MAIQTEMEQKILEAAIACVEKIGEGRATVREIAREAGVNVAAINYYFRTKAQLMDRVREITLENAFDWSDFADSEEKGPRARMACILAHLVAGAQAFPQITRSHFLALLDGESERRAHICEFFTQFMNRLYDDMVSRGMAPGDALRDRLIQAVSASVLGIGLHADLWSAFRGADMKIPAVRDGYIEELLDRLFETQAE